mgnify:CR=1 FL=1
MPNGFGEERGPEGIPGRAIGIDHKSEIADSRFAQHASVETAVRRGEWYSPHPCRGQQPRANSFLHPPNHAASRSIAAWRSFLCSASVMVWIYRVGMEMVTVLRPMPAC